MLGTGPYPSPELTLSLEVPKEKARRQTATDTKSDRNGKGRWGNGNHGSEPSTRASAAQWHLEAAGEELQAGRQVAAAVQPFQSLQALQADFSMLWRKMEPGLTILYSTPTGPSSPSGRGLLLGLGVLRVEDFGMSPS